MRISRQCIGDFNASLRSAATVIPAPLSLRWYCINEHLHKSVAGIALGVISQFISTNDNSRSNPDFKDYTSSETLLTFELAAKTDGGDIAWKGDIVFDIG